MIGKNPDFPKTIHEEETIELPHLTVHIQDDTPNNRAIVTRIDVNGTKEMLLQNGSIYIVYRDGTHILTKQIEKTDQVRYEIKHILGNIINLEIY